MENKKNKKRLSIPRLLLLSLAIAGIVAFCYLNGPEVIHKATAESHSEKKNATWFAAYVDATLTPQLDFEQLSQNVVLSFIVADSENGEPSWGAAYSLEEAASSLELDRRIARVRQNGYDVIVSFGGLANDELALNAEDADDLMAAYLSVVERYELSTIDLDLENEGLTDSDQGQLRAKAIAKLQEERSQSGEDLAVWLTLPVITTGLTEDGVQAIETMLEAGVDLAGVNLMTMNFGETYDDDESMGQNCIDALVATHNQLSQIYQGQGTYLSDATLWSKLGATPMIGQNDVSDEVFTLDDAAELNQFAQEKGLGRLSMWSANRDRESTQSSINTGVVSNHYSGVEQTAQAFSNSLKAGLEGTISTSAQTKTSSEMTAEESEALKTDDPETSPYQIWSEDTTYLVGTKVVWQHSVYQAQWWTQGDEPAVPLDNNSSNPWQLIGPVLDGETPVEEIKLPSGTYPEWDSEAVYTAGDYVMLDDNAYVAKWWNQADTPEKATTSPDDSPWKLLTQEEIQEILDK
ncbi:chitinase [Enterococcus sp. HY326]|uniref:chitinase n=1 Tax=Enterococcus sp. HY326 TaxID=2971265 RepID=UPI00223F66CC|nr:carbohydrate-binding protein [Enterococcus sp. HY326]